MIARLAISLLNFYILVYVLIANKENMVQVKAAQIARKAV